MAIRTVELSDEQLLQIAEGLDLLIQSKLRILIEEGDDERLAKVQCLSAFCKIAPKEPNPVGRVFKFAL